PPCAARCARRPRPTYPPSHLTAPPAPVWSDDHRGAGWTGGDLHPTGHLTRRPLRRDQRRHRLASRTTRPVAPRARHPRDRPPSPGPASTAHPPLRRDGRRLLPHRTGGVTMMCATAAVQMCLDAGDPGPAPRPLARSTRAWSGTAGPVRQLPPPRWTRHGLGVGAHARLAHDRPDSGDTWRCAGSTRSRPTNGSPRPPYWWPCWPTRRRYWPGRGVEGRR